MSSKSRAIVAALLVVGVALGAALFVGYKQGLQAAQTSLLSNSTDIASVDLKSMLGDGATLDQQLLGRAYRRAQESFYKPVDPQALLAGERQGLLAYLQYKHVKHAALPAYRASGDQVQDRQKIFDELAFAQKHYSASAPGIELTEAAVSGMLSALKDPYTVYLSPKEIQGLNESLAGGNFGGIGVYIELLKNGTIIVAPIEGLPAARAGIKPGDTVVSVDGHSTKGQKLDAVEHLIRGPAGTTVTMVVHPEKSKAPRSFHIVREIIHVPSVKAKLVDRVDYIRLADFGETSADEIRKALLEGKAHHARGYILDLRDNGGGLLEAAVQISSFFIPSGTIVSTVDRQGQRETRSALGDAIAGLSPLVVLVNQYTASASEITSGAIQDYGIGKLIGTKTFGKGVVQSIYPLPDNGALKITTARYLTPKDRDIQHKGIQPDIVVTQNPDLTIIDTAKDKQLAAAKAYLRRAASR